MLQKSRRKTHSYKKYHYNFECLLRDDSKRCNATPFTNIIYNILLENCFFSPKGRVLLQEYNLHYYYQTNALLIY